MGRGDAVWCRVEGGTRTGHWSPGPSINSAALPDPGLGLPGLNTAHQWPSVTKPSSLTTYHRHLPLTPQPWRASHTLINLKLKKFKHFKFILKYIHLCILSCGAQFNAKKVFYDSTHSACFISFDDFRCLTQSLNIWQLLLMQTDHDTDTGLFRQLICVNLLHKVWRI